MTVRSSLIYCSTVLQEQAKPLVWLLSPRSSMVNNTRTWLLSLTPPMTEASMWWEKKSNHFAVLSSWWAKAWASNWLSLTNVIVWPMQLNSPSEEVSSAHLFTLIFHFQISRWKVHQDHEILLDLQLRLQNNSSFAVKMHKIQIRPSRWQFCAQQA